MDAHNTLQLLLDANTHVLTAIYTPPPARPAPVAAETAETALPAGESDANEDADASDEDAERAGDAALASDLPNWDSLAAAAAEQGWTTEALDNHAVIAFIDMCRDAVAPVQGTIGKVQDGSYELELSADRMAAMITLLPPKGGRPVALQTVRQALADQGIVHGLLETELAEAVEQGRTGTLLVAQGTPPTRGTPTRFESLLDRLKPRAQEIDELAQVDYRDLGSLLLVTPGTPLMRRIPRCPASMAATCWASPCCPTRWPTRNSPATCPASRSIRTTRCCCARRSPAAPS